jgi:PhzF family phenazine biosynthesis protein
VCRSLKLGGDALRLEMGAGLISVVARQDRWTLTAPNSSWRELQTSRAALAHALGLKEHDIGNRPLWVKAGKEQLIVPLNSEEAVRRASPDSNAFANIQSEDGRGMAYIFAERGAAAAGSAAQGAESPGAKQTLARFFFPQNGAMIEDPATGSATANFGGWCLAMEWAPPLRFEISQGESVRRPSSLYLEIDTGRQIRVGGDVIEIGRGSVTLG